MNYYLKCLRQYADFSGRARRAEYWYFTLFNAIFVMAIAFVFGFIGGIIGGEQFGTIMGSVCYYAYCLAVFIPGLAVCVRRLHDIGKSGWYYLLVLIPLVGAIILLVFFCTDSQPGSNQWGPNPKGIG
ncbi:MAG: DUF805 domain-containing protein [Muribaculaceae bacterium]|nr:DUF805 domain-containing protein [Muribaculaceae bacterium]